MCHTPLELHCGGGLHWAASRRDVSLCCKPTSCNVAQWRAWGTRLPCRIAAQYPGDSPVARARMVGGTLRIRGRTSRLKLDGEVPKPEVSSALRRSRHRARWLSLIRARVSLRLDG